MKKRKIRLFFFAVLWLITIATFSGVIISQGSNYNHFRRELNQAREDLAHEKRIHEELLDRQFYYESDNYIEQLAREQLGFVRPDEIVFVNIAD